MAPCRRIVMIAFPDAQTLDVVGPLEVFARTTRWLNDHGVTDEAAYSVEIAAGQPGVLLMSSGLEVVAARGYTQICGGLDTVMVAGGRGSEAACEDVELLAWLRERHADTPRLASVCSGALIMAAAGLLAGREATTHWASCDTLRRLAPTCRVNPDAIYVRSGRVLTSAGVTAGIDLALALVEEDWGKAVAVAVAQELVVYRRRSGGQQQFSRYLEAERRSDRIGMLQVWMLDNLGGDLTNDRLAERVGLSPRHFARRFRAATGMTPSAYVLLVRTEEARRRIEAGAKSLKEVAHACGFSGEQGMRRAFLNRLGVAPADYRTHFGG